MRIKICGLPVLMCALASCSTLQDVERAQSRNTELLTQQSIRLELQEENLAQLAESQQDLAVLLDRLDMRTRRIEARLPEPTPEEKEAQEVLAEADPPAPPATEVNNGSPPHDKAVVGRNEWVWLDLLKRNLKARVDTGALSSSLSAIDIQPFERDGDDWVRFRVPDEDHPDGGELYETPLVRWVRIRQASSEDLERRPVVRLVVRLGDLVEKVEFNLSDRQNMLYPMLLGRNFLRDIAVVDVARKFTWPKYQPEDKNVQAQ